MLREVWYLLQGSEWDQIPGSNLQQLTLSYLPFELNW